MKTSERFTNAVTKLYNAFHEDRLNAWSCSACAVGNICNNAYEWSASTQEGVYAFKKWPSEVPDLNMFPKTTVNPVIKESGYSTYELAMVETLFLKHMPKEGKETKDQQFKGLCAVVEYLCELEGIPNVMDYTCLFETENDKPKHQLQEVF